MRVALVSAEVSPFVGGGIAPMVRATAQILAGAGHHVDLFTREVYRAKALAYASELPVFRHPRVQWHWVPDPPNDAPHWHLEMAQHFDRALFRAYEHAAPDLVEIQDYQGLGAVVATDRAQGRLGDAIVVNRLNTSAEQLAAFDGTEFDPEVARLERISLQAADLLVAPSQAVLDFYASTYNLTLPPGAVAWPGFLRDDAPQPLPASPDVDGPLRVLALGRYQRVKGTDGLAEAMVEHPELDLQLTFVGGDTLTGPSGSMRQHVERIVGDDERVVFHGPVPRHDVTQFLAEADVLVVASAWEAWGNVALESLSATRPLIVTPRASLPEIAGHGEFGIVAEGHEVADLAAALQRAVDERARLRALAGNDALSTHLERLTDEGRVVAGYEQLAERTERTQSRAFDDWRASLGD